MEIFHKKKKKHRKKREFDVIEDLGGRPEESNEGSNSQLPTELTAKLEEWTTEEERILQQNLAKYCNDTKIRVGRIFAFDERSEEEQQKVLQICPDFKTLFQERISVGIQRSQEEVYAKAKMLYYTSKKKIITSTQCISSRPSKDGTLTEEDIENAEIVHKTLGLSSAKGEKLDQLRLQGIPVHFGRFSYEEDQLLVNNVKEYCQEHGINKLAELFAADGDVRDEAWKDINQKDFRYAICKGIFRPPMYICDRAARLFGDSRSGKFSDEEMESLMKLHEKYGRNWARIGVKMNRNRNSLSKKFGDLKPGRVTGPWSSEELEQLKTSVKEALCVDDLQGIHSNIPWKEISKKIPTRTATQCRQEWNSYVIWRASDNNVTDNWNIEDNIKLIHRLYEIPDLWAEKDIDWEELHQHFPNSPTPQHLQRKWYLLKTRWVQRIQLKPLEDILTELHDHVLPVLVDEAEGKRRRTAPSGNSTEFYERDSADSESEEQTSSLDSPSTGSKHSVVGEESESDSTPLVSGKAAIEAEKVNDTRPSGSNDAIVKDEHVNDNPQAELNTKRKRKGKHKKKSKRFMFRKPDLS
ncbi:cyclin-D-binding Myb-like transcription factor 1 [Ptychodera flava]|uniref:cyclin-D-binding Myb-like transcription factor 1 n=1 Tax=Ptychodera flava TaxID=63121 RepID=UPI00396AA21C